MEKRSTSKRNDDNFFPGGRTRYPGINTEEKTILPVWRSLVRSTNEYSGSEKHCDDGFLPEK